MDEDGDKNELEASKSRHPSNRKTYAVSGVDPEGVPGVWRRSRVDGYVWFEPELWDGEIGLDTGEDA